MSICPSTMRLALLILSIVVLCVNSRFVLIKLRDDSANPKYLPSNSTAQSRGLYKYGSRILNGQIIPAHSKPYLVDVVEVCTGSILGKRHILSAAHCFIGGWFNKARFFDVGSHDTRSHIGQRLQRTSIEGIDKDGQPVQFPVDPSVYSITTNLIDIAVITVHNNIRFTENVKKVRLEFPKAASDDCLICSGDCHPNKMFNVYGWGYYSGGRSWYSEFFYSNKLVLKSYYIKLD